MAKRLSASDIVYENIKKKIIELEYEPEKTLNEEMLTNEVGVSRTPLRQALYRLELEGLVIKKSNGRIHVAPVSIQEAEEIFKVREVLEGLIVREATARITPEEIMELEKTMQLMTLAAENGLNYDSVRYGSEFHHIFYKPSGNQIAVQFLDQLNSRLERYRRFSGYKHPQYQPMISVQEHQEILDCIKKGDADMAEKTMRAHIRRSLEVTKETLNIVGFSENHSARG
jgi:DNA-binding GntR family transcriptional regulator